ncbi:MAG: hypothetical protein NC299_12905 [Lachnospiraceae bacterium]|nr:hypothetical protein [Ruminococcus sp.]MCM1276237.1 hypothetical protein [Lachnospiraceae bacterium]
MAIIRTFTAKNGAHITVDDSAIAGVSDEEMQKRIDLMLKTAEEIWWNEMRRRAAAERAKQKAEA